MQKIGVFWGVRGHPRSSETSPFATGKPTKANSAVHPFEVDRSSTSFNWLGNVTSAGWQVTL